MPVVMGSWLALNASRSVYGKNGTYRAEECCAIRGDDRAAGQVSPVFGCFDFEGDRYALRIGCPAAGCNPAFGVADFVSPAQLSMPPLRGGGWWSQDGQELVGKSWLHFLRRLKAT